MRNDMLATIAAAILMMTLLVSAGAGAMARALSGSFQDDLATVLEGIEQSAAEVEDLRADFRQVRHTPLLRKPLESSGTIRMNRDLLIWETEAPQRSTMAISAGEVRIHYPDDKLLEIYEMEEEMGPIAASPLVRVEELEKSFTFQLIDEEDTSDEEGETTDVELISLRLTPKGEPLSKHLASITLRIARSDGLVRSAIMVNPDGERTEIDFESIELNEGGELIDITRNPPEGTTVSRPGRRVDNSAVERAQ